MSHQYLKWDEKIITDFSAPNISSLYNQGYLFGRVEKGEMYQTRSVRIDLDAFSLSSENRRVLRKNETVAMSIASLPYSSYDWSIGKLAKDFYDTKFGKGTFSANKVKELLTEPGNSSFTNLFIFSDNTLPIGFCISFINEQITHYCYPFYSLDASTNSAFANLGLGMMTKAILWTKEQGKKYIYLGSASRPADTYKLQFDGLEWYDGKKWRIDQSALRATLKHL